eukprot:7119821-Prymnesium_polylepis.1
MRPSGVSHGGAADAAESSLTLASARRCAAARSIPRARNSLSPAGYAAAAVALGTPSAPTPVSRTPRPASPCSHS